MSCFWRHKWGKWEQFVKSLVHITKDGKKIPFVRDRQRRKCSKCGMAETRDVDY